MHDNKIFWILIHVQGVFGKNNRTIIYFINRSISGNIATRQYFRGKNAIFLEKIKYVQKFFQKT